MVALTDFIVPLTVIVMLGPTAGHGWRNRNCGFVSAPKIYDGATMELDVCGHRGTSAHLPDGAP